MNYHFAEYLILRTPVFSSNEYHGDTDEMLARPIFQAAIYLASPGFYQRLALTGFKTGALSIRERTTLQKYLNRACYRPTPFGLFAGVTLVSWQENGKIVIRRQLSAVLEPDQAIVQQQYESDKAQFSEGVKFSTNHSIYRVMNEYRFIRTEIGPDGRRQYQLQSTNYSQVLKNLLKFCRHAQTGTAVIGNIIKLAGCDPEEAADYAEFLMDTQILLPELRPGLTGQMLSLTQVIDQLSLTPSYFGNLTVPLKKTIASDTFREGHSSYVILQRSLTSAGLDLVWRECLRDGIFALDLLCPPDELPAMLQFRQAFHKHFEGQRISLLAALDPEGGIGYQEPVSEVVNPLLETLHIFPQNTAVAHLAWTTAHAYLLQRWIMTESNQQPVIQLETEGLNKLRKEETNQELLGLSVLFRTTANKVWVESAGGNNALALAGRFTIGNTAISHAAKKIAAQLEAQNPEMLFAEILQLSDPHTDNVNRRESLWNYELPVTASSQLPASNQLQLADLYLEIHNGMVYLWSETHQKFVVPRLTSAYNHRLNKLPLFRFLADLSYQYGRTNLSFDLRSFFPGLDHYPRVEYQNAILSPATWILTAEQLRPIQKTAEGSLLQAFQEMITACGLPAVFAAAEGDQQLVFHAEHVQDALFFAEFIRQKKEITLHEFFEPDTSVVSDQAGTAYVAQFNAMLLPDEPLPIPTRLTVKHEKKTAARKFMPGTEWLYLKIYLPGTKASRLLLRIRPLIRRKYAHGTVSKWFFIRYQDHAPHIRLRLKVDPKNISEVLIAFRQSLEGHIRQQVIREYQLDVYSRELERYQVAGIDLTEDHFEASSDFVLQYLGEGKTAPPTYLAALITVQAMTATLIPGSDEQLGFYRESFEGLLLEFEGDAMRRELDLKYRELGREIDTALQAPGVFNSKSLSVAFNKLHQSVQTIKAGLQADSPMNIDYLRSLIHMHLNRLFTDQQRTQEMVIYFLLYKYATSMAGRRKHQAN